MALETQLLDIKDVASSNGVLVHVTGGDDITLEEVTRAGEMVMRTLPSNVRIIWGARVDPHMKGKTRVMVVLTGVETNFTQPRESSVEQQQHQQPAPKRSKWWG